MTMRDELQSLNLGAGKSARDIAYRYDLPRYPGGQGIFWLAGFMSDMASTKAAALARLAADRGYGCTRFDYSGHGESGGVFTDGTIGRWLEEARAVFEQVSAGPQIIVGSSMGGYIALLLLRALQRDAPAAAQRIKGIVLIAPAWDMTEELMWKKFPAHVRDEIMTQGFHLRPSAYDQPYTITRALIEDGRQHLLAGRPFDPGCPVTILQGLKDPDVPPEHTRRLLTFMTGPGVKLVEIEDGEHRLSRPEDLAKLCAAVDEIAARPG
jgi:pimeloyl-ACP methyl ester carboxylesterase